eukprot:TRINITY_DN341_c0_g1_i1.p1 TRINITY_DN341_c0_g1~~TRINITY_DN341_c0_g1_i1.p1  ORF type:complete len:202 (-),score=56.94 TRINITY_DN341_c0_g1_i1:191-796(-)
MTSSAIFEVTERFKLGLELVNNLESPKFPLFLSRIVKGLHLRNESVFSTAEEEQLQAIMGLSNGELHMALELSSFIFEQAAYHSLQPKDLAAHLLSAGLDQDKVEIYFRVWQAEREKVVEKLRERTVVPEVLTSIDWRLHLQMAKRGEERLRSPSALFHFTLSDSDTNQEKEKVAIEFSHTQLFDFFSQLEIIQHQLDSLG